MTCSGQYHGNALNKYHSWGRGRGTQQSFMCVGSAPRSNPLIPFYIPFLTEKGTPFVHLPLTTGTPFMSLFCAYATGLPNWGQEDGKTFVLDKRDRAIAFVFCRDLHLTSLCSGLFQDLFEERWSLAEIFFKHSYSHVCHTRCSVSFLFRSIAHVHWGQSNEAKFKLGH